jgi:hypothetical protein
VLMVALAGIIMRLLLRVLINARSI